MALSQGAEGDISAYLAARYFQKRVFSTAVGAIVSAFSLSSAAGSVILAAFLSQTDSYVQFMYAMAVTTVIGSFLILRIGRYPPAGDEASEQVPSAASD
jgi:predicted MFS family arabinose efflux permease